MSAADSLLVFVSKAGAFESWIRLSGGRIADRGVVLEDLAELAPSQAGLPAICLVVPGDEVALHWVEMPPGLAPLQAAGAARLMAEDLSVQPIEEMHVAVGREFPGSGTRCLAIVARDKMGGWIGNGQAHGLDPDMIVPAPLLLLPKHGETLRFDGFDTPIFRGPASAFSAEESLADLLVAPAAVERISDGRFESELAEAIERRPVDLRQGQFAKRKRWIIEWRLVRRLAMLAAAILIASLAIQVVSTFRYTFAADRLEAEATRLAADAVPGGTSASDPRRQLRERFYQLPGSGGSFGEMASALFAAVNATPNAEIVSIDFQSGSLRAMVTGDSPATIETLRQRLATSGLAVSAGPNQIVNGKVAASMSIRTP